MCGERPLCEYPCLGLGLTTSSPQDFYLQVTVHPGRTEKKTAALKPRSFAQPLLVTALLTLLDDPASQQTTTYQQGTSSQREQRSSAASTSLRQHWRRRSRWC